MWELEAATNKETLRGQAALVAPRVLRASGGRPLALVSDWGGGMKVRQRGVRFTYCAGRGDPAPRQVTNKETSYGGVMS